MELCMVATIIAKSNASQTLIENGRKKIEDLLLRYCVFIRGNLISWQNKKQ